MKLTGQFLLSKMGIFYVDPVELNKVKKNRNALLFYKLVPYTSNKETIILVLSEPDYPYSTKGSPIFVTALIGNKIYKKIRLAHICNKQNNFMESFNLYWEKI